MGHIWTQLLQELVTPVSPAVKFENFLTETLKKDRREDHRSIKCFLTYTLKYFPIHSSVYLFLCMYMFTWRGWHVRVMYTYRGQCSRFSSLLSSCGFSDQEQAVRLDGKDSYLLTLLIEPPYSVVR